MINEFTAQPSKGDARHLRSAVKESLMSTAKMTKPNRTKTLACTSWRTTACFHVTNSGTEHQASERHARSCLRKTPHVARRSRNARKQPTVTCQPSWAKLNAEE